MSRTGVPGIGRGPALAVLGLLVAGVALLALGVGPRAIGPGEALAILGHRLTGLGPDPEPLRQAIVLQLRLPRVLLAGLVGAALALAGAALQGLFRNPLADPGLLGVSTSAALAAVAAIVVLDRLLGGLPAALAAYGLPLVAFAGALVGTALIHRLGTREGRVDVPLMLLLGIALNAVAGAGIGVLAFVAEAGALRTLTQWGLGSFAGADWPGVTVLAAGVLVAGLVLARLATALNVFLLGEAEAGHLGMPVEAVKRRVVLLASLATGLAVAFAGTIGFVGLVVPHLVRLALGPDHRLLVPASALGGALLAMLADLLARGLAPPAEIPVGLITALLGGPLLFWLLLRGRGRY